MPEDPTITWSAILKAIRSEMPQREVYQGLVTRCDEATRSVWVAELSSDPIEVVGHDHEITYYRNGIKKVTRVSPAVPQLGDIVLILRTSSDTFKCVGVLQTTRKWTPTLAIGL